MNTLLLRAATACVRAWTALYTLALSPQRRNARRAEIESDLWEFQADSRDGAAGAAAHVFVRLLRGIPDDLGWCLEQTITADTVSRRGIRFGGRMAGAALFICALWVIDADASRRRPATAGAPPSAAQSSAGAAAGIWFEITSVKPNPAGRAGMTRSQVQPGGRFVAENMAVVLLIGQAFQVQAYQLIGGPSWIWSEGFDIDARANGDLAPAGGRRPIQGALRGLLADRFQLTTHMETRQLPVYELVLARNDGRLGPNLTRSSRENCADILAQVAARGAGDGPPPPPPPNGLAPPCGAVNRNGSFSLDSATTSQLARFLTGELNRKVFDRTGLTGLFNAHLTWTPDPLPSGPLSPELPPIDPNSPSIFTAVQEQLGLKLESTTGPVEILVIDSVEHPTPN